MSTKRLRIWYKSMNKNHVPPNLSVYLNSTQWQSSHTTFLRIWNLMRYLRIKAATLNKVWTKTLTQENRLEHTLNILLTKERATGSSPSVLRSACITMVSPCAKRSLVVASAFTPKNRTQNGHPPGHRGTESALSHGVEGSTFKPNIPKLTCHYVIYG